MPQKKPKHDPKKQPATSVSQEEDRLIQQQLATYQQLATTLYSSHDTLQAEAALTPITSLSESAQVVLLQALSREKATEAADILLAVHTFAPLKEIRKEARRSLIRLEGIKNYPHWTPPPPPAPVVEEALPTKPPRFWKGLLTDTRITGEVQLLLFWEQGDYNKEVRTLGFLLEFFHDGVKDFFTDIRSKHQIENLVERTRAQFGNIPLVSCNIANGKRLVEEALAVNQKNNTKPHSDYQHNLALVQNMLLNAPDDISEKGTSEQVLRFDEAKNLLEQLMDMELDPEETVAGFLDTWLRGDYEAAYTTLAIDSPLREGLTAAEWVARRRAWAEQAHPTQGKSEIAYRIEEEEDDFEDDENTEEIDVTPALDVEESATPPEVEAFWSLVLTDTEAGNTLKELPQATIVYKGTGRHWFWTKYTLVHENNKWCILTMIDAGSQALSTPADELLAQLQEISEYVSEQLELEELEDEELDDDDDVEDEELDDDEDEYLDDEELDELEDDELDERFAEIMSITTRAMHYVDALLTQTPEDSTLYTLAYDQAVTIQESERAAAYVEMQAERFPELRGEALRKLAGAQINIASTYDENDEEEEAQKFFAQAEQTLRTSISIDNSPMANIMLAQLLIVQEKQLTEATQLLQKVLTQPDISTPELTLAEAALGTIAQSQANFELALKHYQKAAELSPDMPGIWFQIGMIQHHLGQNEEAEASYHRSLMENPTETDSYVELAGLYTENDQLDAAEELLETGMEINPDAADLLAAMALVSINKGDLRRAKEFLDEAEDIDEELEIVQAVHEHYENAKKAQKQQTRPKGKSRKFKKK